MKADCMAGFAKGNGRQRGKGLLVAFALLLPCLVATAAPQAPVPLGTAANFAVLAGPSISSTSGGTINGNVGVSPGNTFVPGTPAVTVNGTIHLADGVALQAQNDLVTAYNDAAGRTLPALVAGGALGGLTLAPGLYKDDGAPVSLGLTGTLTLDAQGDPNAVWIFQSASTVIAESGSAVVLINGALACNVFWQVGSSATIRTGATFKGNILALSAITLETLATLEGRALARNAAVTLDNNTVGITSCGPATFLGVPADTNLSCEVEIPAPPLVTASSACSTQLLTVVMTQTNLPGRCANSYTIRRVWTAIDDCGDSFSATQLITVDDTTAPTILVCAAPVTVQCEADVPAADTNSVTATDNCGDVTITHIGDSALEDPCGGTITRTYRATDECGNFADCTQTITVNDTTPPQITCPPSPMEVANIADCQGTVPDLTQVQTSDNCGGGDGLQVTQLPTAGTTFMVQTNVTLTVTDQCGNTAVCTVILTTPCLLPTGYTIVKTVSNAVVQVGDTIVFQITVANTGNVALLTVPLEDRYATNILAFVAAVPPPTDTVNDGILNWTNVGPLAVGESTNLLVTFTAVGSTAGQLATNVAVASPPQLPPKTATVPYSVNVRPTPVVLESFGATYDGDDVLVSWKTAVELENLGFNVYRAVSVDGPRLRINGDLIPGMGTSEGQQYALRDSVPDPAQTYYYWLEDVSWRFQTVLNGPVAARGREAPQVAASIGSFSVVAGGLYRIGWDVLAAALVPAQTLDASQIQIYVNGLEVAIYVSAADGTLSEGDYILFYVPDSGKAQMCDIGIGTDAARMPLVFARPSRVNGDVAAGIAGPEQAVFFDVSTNYVRYILSDFTQTPVWVLDITDPQESKLLYGYSYVRLTNGLSAVYLSYSSAATEPARCTAVGQQAVFEVQVINWKP